ncbi:MAG: NAD(P)H-dependent oxidoreductase [Spirochaetales bacterium]|nr:NAD(P)H-dependent oxidoreductase [Spirochaetales bacterium]
MKILVIHGCSKNGNTTELVRYFSEQLFSLRECEQESLYLQDYDLPFCTGCHNCILRGEDKCPHFQVVSSIEKKIMNADLLILATPGYMFNVTGIMKNFLDHVAYNCHRPKYFGKRIYMISSCTKWQAEGVFLSMRTWGSAAGFDPGGEFYTDMLPLPYSAALLEKKRRIVSVAAEKLNRKLDLPLRQQPDFGNLMVFKLFAKISSLAPGIFVADHAFYSDKKAQSRDINWHFPVKIPLYKRIFRNYILRVIDKAFSRDFDLDKAKDEQGFYKNKL